MSRLLRAVYVGASLLAWAGLPVMSQPPAQQPDLADPRLQKMKENMDKAGTTSWLSENGAVEAAPQKNDVSIVAGQDRSVAKISLIRELAHSRLIGTLSTPVSTQDDATRFFTLGGPEEDIQLGIAWKKQSYDTRRLSQLDLPEQAERRDAICDQFKVQTCADTELEDAMKKAGAPSAEIARTLKNFNAVKLVGSDRVLSLFRAIPFHYLSLDGSVGRTERKFFDLPGAEKKDDRLSYSLSASYGRIFEKSRVTLDFMAQRQFRDAAKARKCTVVAGSTLERCRDLPLGEAAMVDSVPLAVEYRIFRGLFAISPKLVYDFKQHVAAASLPIYFLRDSAGKLTGGFRIDWEEHERPVASVFVSSPLGLD